MTQLTAPGVIPAWTITDRLRKAREEAGLSQRDLADLMGIGRSTVSNYEAGTTRPRRTVLLAWAMATGVHMTWLEHGLSVITNDQTAAVLPHLDSNQEPSDSRPAQHKAAA